VLNLNKGKKLALDGAGRGESRKPVRRRRSTMSWPGDGRPALPETRDQMAAMYPELSASSHSLTGKKHRLTPQQLELEQLQHEARLQVMQSHRMGAFQNDGLMGALGMGGLPQMAPPRYDKNALAPHMGTMMSQLAVGGMPPMSLPAEPLGASYGLDVGGEAQGVPGGQSRRAHLSTCHGALLLGGVEHFVSSAGQRVCPDCQALCRAANGSGRGQIFVDKQRVRLLMQPVGVWSKARDFYTRWEVRCPAGLGRK